MPQDEKPNAQHVACDFGCVAMNQRFKPSSEPDGSKGSSQNPQNHWHFCPGFDPVLLVHRVKSLNYSTHY
jgi:hypothetical protein